MTAVAPPLDGRSVVLVGLMGCGKSSVGRKLAEALGLPFVDADAEIVAAAGCSIEEIFERYGEAAFREGERRVVARLLAGGPLVLATGGGAFMDAETRALIAGCAVSVWLRADLDTLVTRIGRRGGRPLLKGVDPRVRLAELIERRYPVYALADVTVDNGEEPIEETCARIRAAIERLARPAERRDAVGA